MQRRKPYGLANSACAGRQNKSARLAVSIKDLLTAHKLLIAGLVDELGRYRSGGVGIHGAKGVIHMAPPADRVAGLMKNFLDWLRRTDEHPLIVSAVFHYEFEFIHPFQDGNGRMGRLWQTLILSRWQPVFASMPVESLVRDHRAGYYAVLNACNQSGESTQFIDFMLQMILASVRAVTEQESEHETEQVTDQVGRLLAALGRGTLSARELMSKLELAHRPSFLYNYLQPALRHGWIEMTLPETPRVRNQKYRLSIMGRGVLSARRGKAR